MNIPHKSEHGQAESNLAGKDYGNAGQAPFYLSQYAISRNACLKLRLYDTYSVHRVVYDLFDPTRLPGQQTSAGILHADRGEQKGWRQILILSDREPMTPDYGSLETRLLPEQYLQCPSYKFEIIVNPVIRKSENGQIEAVRGRREIAHWFANKAEKCGFSPIPLTLQVLEVWMDKFRKNNGYVTLCKAKITGMLQVNNQAQFLGAMREGIGRGKAFGCGLLQIVPASMARLPDNCNDNLLIT